MGWVVVAEAADGEEAVRQAEGHKPDVAVIDMRLPLSNALDVARRIIRSLPATRIVVLGSYTDEACLTRIIEAGAGGYLLKDAADYQLADAVNDVVAGRVFTPPLLARREQEVP